MSVLGSAMIEIAPDTSGFATKLHKDVTEAVDKTSASTSGAFNKLAGVGQAALVGLAGGAVTFGAMAVKAAIEGEQSTAQLRQAIENAGDSFKKVQPLVDATSDKFAKFGYENDVVEGAMTRLVQITGSSTKSLGLLQTAADLAAARHIDLTTAANLVGRAAEGNIAPLKKMGIQVEDTGSAAGNAKAAIQALNDRFGGSAQAQADTFGGKMKALHAEFGNLTEKVGNFLLPILEHLAASVVDLIDWFDKHRVVLIAVGAVIGTVLVAAIGAYIATMVVATATTLAAAAPFIAIAAAVAALAAGVVYAYTHWAFFHDAVDKVVQVLRDDVWPIIQTIAGFMEDHWKPILIGLTIAIGAVVAPLALVAAGLIYLYEKFGIVRETVDTFSRILVDTFKIAVDTAVLIISQLIDYVKLIVRVVTDVVTVIVDIFHGDWKGAWDAFKDIPLAVIDFVKATFGNFMGWFASVPGLILSALGDLTTLLWHVGVDIIGGLMNGVGSVLDGVVNWFRQLPGNIGAWIGDTLVTLIGKGADLLRGMMNGVGTALDAMVNWFRQLPGNVGAWIGDTVVTLVGKGADLLNGLLHGVGTVLGGVVDWFRQLPGNIGSWVGDLGSVLFHAGARLIQGLIDGAKSLGGGLKNAIGDQIRSLPGGGTVAGVLGFASGGLVPGPAGAPMLAVVHGGEFVLSRDMLMGSMPTTAPVAGAMSSVTIAAGAITQTFAAGTDRATVDYARDQIALVLGEVLDRAAAGTGRRQA